MKKLLNFIAIFACLPAQANFSNFRHFFPLAQVIAGSLLCTTGAVIALKNTNKAESIIKNISMRYKQKDTERTDKTFKPFKPVTIDDYQLIERTSTMQIGETDIAKTDLVLRNRFTQQPISFMTAVQQIEKKYPQSPYATLYKNIGIGMSTAGLGVLLNGLACYK